MGIINENRLLLQHLFSAQRREIVKILAKEWWLGLQLRFKKPDQVVQHCEPDPAADTWLDFESRLIDPTFFERGWKTVVEDQVGADGRIHSKYQHLVQQLFCASTYTNGTTHRSIFTRSGECVENLSYRRPKSRRLRIAPSQRQLPVSRNIKGVTANLYGTVASADGNYFHWFVDSLSRLFMIEKFHSLDDIDHILVPPLHYDFQWETLEALGFNRSQIVELHPLECLQFDCLLASSPPRGKGSAICPGWIIDRYNETLLEEAKDVQSVVGKRVYISRRDAPSRMFINEEEVCRLMESRGFDVVELTPLNVWQKIAVFRDADIIVSQTGAGLANLIFCHSSMDVLELVDTRFVYPPYASLAVYRGGTHHVHYFSNESALGRVNAIVAKSSLDISELENTLDKISA